MPILLGDDGTLDTVLYCSWCGREYRFTYDPIDRDELTDDMDATDEQRYDEFVAECLQEVEEEHTCGSEE